MLVGILAGLVAGAFWGLTFVAPKLVAPFSPFDLAALRNIIFGALSGLLLLMLWQRTRALLRADIVIAAWLGFIGYVGYYMAVAYAVIFAGPAIPALIIGALPVALAIAGNLQERSVRWRSLTWPLVLITLGLLVVNVGSLQDPASGRDARSLLIGGSLATIGLLIWLCYAMVNAAALRQRPGMSALVWTALQGVGTGIGMVALLPFGLLAGLSGFATHSLVAPEAHALWFWSMLTGIASSWLATWAWIVAAQRLSIALSAQLIVSETIFALIYGFLGEMRWPAAHEAAGAALLLAGVIVGIHALTRPPFPGQKTLGASV
jgi:drug/metabolite transporter (DMT)-like permease